MFKRKYLKNAIFIAILLISFVLLWLSVYRGIVTIPIAVLLTFVATAAFLVAFAVKHPETGKTVVGAMAGAWAVCALVAQAIDLKEPTAWINQALAPFRVTLNEQTFLFLPFFCFFAVFFVLFQTFGIFGDSTAMGIHSEDGDPEFRKKSFTERNADFCKVLLQRIDKLNRDTDWNENLFTPLEAEVEVVSRNRRKRRYEDLLRCLKKTRRGSTVYLVLGNPGSGKSVSMRKLCMDLLKEAKRTGKTPVYINLKQWNRNWNQKRLPDKDDLIQFVEQQLREDGDLFTDEFLNQYFKRMLEDGRWYFVFDSFDEMPCLMGEDNNQPIISHISRLLFEFLTGPNQSGGVIASRLYKAPSEALGATVTLRIQEFSDIKIKTMLNRYLVRTKGVIGELFGKREDLVAICRNPFYLTLLINYIREKGLALPKDQVTLYQNFMEGRLRRCEAKLKEEAVSPDELYAAAKRLASVMQDSTEYGLECPASALYRQPEGRKKWRTWLSLLAYAKICRFGGSEDTVSFVHRRFQEFFLVKDMMDNGQAFAYQDVIVSNAGSLRDALVLYCEVADKETVKEIAQFCWKTVQDNIQYKDSILHKGAVVLTNTLYFMAEAFRNRKEAVADFCQEFETFVTENLDKSADFAVQIALINSMALLGQEYLQKVVLRVFQLDNRWLNDEVMKNCRLIEKLDSRVEQEFTNYFHRMPLRDFFRRYENTQFSLSIPSGFQYVRTVHSLTWWWYTIVGNLSIALTVFVFISVLIYGPKALSSTLFFNTGTLYFDNATYSIPLSVLRGFDFFSIVWEIGWLIFLDIVYHAKSVLNLPEPKRVASQIPLACLLCASGLLLTDILFVNQFYFPLAVDKSSVIRVLMIPKTPLGVFRVLYSFVVWSTPVLFDIYWIAHDLKKKLYAFKQKKLFLPALLRILILLLPLLYYSFVSNFSSNISSLANLLMQRHYTEIPVSEINISPKEGNENHVLIIAVSFDGETVLLLSHAPDSSLGTKNFFLLRHTQNESLTSLKISYMDICTRERWEELLSGMKEEWREAAILQYDHAWQLAQVHRFCSKIQQTLPWVAAGILALSAFYAVLITARYLSRWWHDRRLIDTQPVLNSLRRMDLQRIIAQLQTNWWRRAYIGDLVLNRVSLSGEWPEGIRPKGDSDMERNLAILDCESIEDYNYRF